MDNFPKVSCGWSWEENKLFEVALAMVDQQHPDRWKRVAAMIGGQKSAEDVQKHYVILLEDLQFIENLANLTINLVRKFNPYAGLIKITTYWFDWI